MTSPFSLAFFVAYLVIIWGMALLMGWRYASQPPERRRLSRWLLGSVLVLALGDSFHIAPRIHYAFAGLEIVALSWGGRPISWIGVGDFATSFTLTFFYLFALMYRQEKRRLRWTWVERAVIGLLALRLFLLFFPQNNWGGSAPDWRLYRNIPFVLAGLMVAVLFLRTAPDMEGPASRWLTIIAWAIIVSFACYLGTILLVDRYPMAGLFMLPKTIAYVVAVVYFYRLEFAPTPQA